MKRRRIEWTLAAVCVALALCSCSKRADGPDTPEIAGPCPGPGEAFEVVTVGLILDQDGNTVGTVGMVVP